MTALDSTKSFNGAWSLIAQADKVLEERDRQVKAGIDESKLLIDRSNNVYVRVSDAEKKQTTQLLLQQDQIKERDIESAKIDARLENLDQNPGWQLSRIATSAKEGFQRLQNSTCSCFQTVAVIAVSSGAPTLMAYGLGQNPIVLVICGFGGAAAGGIGMAAYNRIKRCCNPKNDKGNYESLEP